MELLGKISSQAVNGWWAESSSAYSAGAFYSSCTNAVTGYKRQG